MATNKRLSDFNPHTIAPGTIVWLKGSSAAHLSTFLDALVLRGMGLFHVGPRDRYVVQSGEVINHLAAHQCTQTHCETCMGEDI